MWKKSNKKLNQQNNEDWVEPQEDNPVRTLLWEDKPPHSCSFALYFLSLQKKLQLSSLNLSLEKKH